MIKDKAFVFAVIFQLAGCTDSGEAPLCDGGGTTVSVDVTGAASLLVYQSASGASTTVAATPAGEHLDLCFSEPFQITVVCVNDPAVTAFHAQQYRGTPSDGVPVYLSCGASSPSSSDTVFHVKGSMATPGMVSMSHVGAGAGAASWQFDLSVSPGTHDLIASDDFSYAEIGAEGRIAIRRNVDVSSDVSLGTIDVHSEGLPPAIVPAVVDGLAADDEITNYGYVSTEPLSNPQISQSTGLQVHTLPTALQQDGDVQTVVITASTPYSAAPPRFSRLVQTTLGGSTLTLALMPRLSNVLSYSTIGDEERASWTPLPGYGEITYSAIGERAVKTVFATHSWVNATGATDLTFDSSVEGYDPAWILGPTRTHDFSLTKLDADGALLETSVSN